MTQLHADAAAARRALQHHRVADDLRLRQRLAEIFQQAGAGQQRHAAVLGQRARGVLEAEVADMPGFGADKGDAVRRAFPGEGGILAEKAVAGMDGLRAGLLRGIQDAPGIEVGVARQRLAQQHGLVGRADMQGMGIRLRVDGNGADGHVAQCAHDAAGNGAAVCYQDLVKHVRVFVSGRVVPPDPEVRRGRPRTLQLSARHIC